MRCLSRVYVRGERERERAAAYLSRSIGRSIVGSLDMRCTHSSLLSCLCTGFRGYDEMCVWLVGRSGWVSELLTTNSRHRHLHLHHLHLGLAISLHGGTDSESHSCSLLYDCRRCTDGFVRQTVAARADIDLVLCLRAEDCRGGTTWMARELCERAGRQAAGESTGERTYDFDILVCWIAAA